MALKLLIVEGNNSEGRGRYMAARGPTPSQSYALVLQNLAPDCETTIVCPADADAALPKGSDLAAFDGIVITGSGLHIYQREPDVTRQIDLIRTAFGAGTPLFGSCWGLQLLTVAAGGSVRRNPKGREFGFARSIMPNEAGKAHLLLRGRPIAFGAPADHFDEVETAATGTTILAANAMSEVQAVEIRQGNTVAWAVQYHPEFSFGELGCTAKPQTMAEQGFFETAADFEQWRTDMQRLDAAPNPALAWKYGLDSELTDIKSRQREISNFIEHLVRPAKAARARI